MKEVWNKTHCTPWIIILVIFYILPSYFDFYPDADAYLGGYGFLGIWGTLALTIIALMLSFLYGIYCVHKSTVYRCVGWGCANDEPPLSWPDEETKSSLYETYKNELKDLPSTGFKSYLPWSDFNTKLRELNNKYLYT